MKQVAENFSRHHFEKTISHIDDSVVWHLIGGSDIHGKDAVIDACKESAKYLKNVKTTFLKFKTFVSENSVIIDSLGEYVEKDGAVSVVSSCDIYEFVEGKLKEITSYTVEIPQTK